ncbi:hypothetical protein BV898_00969 [Hypsibius exemplaris]|uniref:Uncharacterized protein n=1 Tax=Hypsibius exemplaris TaxID=2072580 RepID=A0A1W0XCR9_HYPEX|nr:hypothetical protein BV898_00969 [Hypsibius exemplaris]
MEAQNAVKKRKVDTVVKELSGDEESAEPSVAVKEPTVAVKEPTVAVKEPSVAVKEPSFAVKEPSVAGSDAACPVGKKRAIPTTVFSEDDDENETPLNKTSKPDRNDSDNSNESSKQEYVLALWPDSNRFYPALYDASKNSQNGPLFAAIRFLDESSDVDVKKSAVYLVSAFNEVLEKHPEKITVQCRIKAGSDDAVALPDIAIEFEQVTCTLINELKPIEGELAESNDFHS